MLLQVPTSLLYSYLGVGLIFLSTLFNMFIKPEIKKKESTNGTKTTILANGNHTENITAMNNYGTTADIGIRIQPAEGATATVIASKREPDFFERMNPQMKRVFGLSLSVVAGIFYGQVNTPILYVRENYAGASENSLDYLFSYFSGILLGMLGYFAVYSAIMKNKPVIHREIVLPAMVSGKSQYYMYILDDQR